MLTKADQNKIDPKGYAGKIRINGNQLPKEYPSEISLVLSLLRRTLSREVEAGCRPIIALFLAAAVDRARLMFSNERLAVHSETPIPTIQIPDVGLVGGTLDFMTAKVIGEGPMGELFILPISDSY